MVKSAILLRSDRLEYSHSNSRRFQISCSGSRWSLPLNDLVPYYRISVPRESWSFGEAMCRRSACKPFLKVGQYESWPSLQIQNGNVFQIDIPSKSTWNYTKLQTLTTLTLDSNPDTWQIHRWSHLLNSTSKLIFHLTVLLKSEVKFKFKLNFDWKLNLRLGLPVSSN